jgi:hypothetical protein
VSSLGKVFAATGSGVAQSTDAGATWSIVMSTASPVRVLAAGGNAMIAGLENGYDHDAGVGGRPLANRAGRIPAAPCGQ